METVNANGGKGNGKILSWNFQKDLKLKFEDALFSQLSLNTFMNGRVMAKMSNWTSAIAKLNVANKYGQKNYSIKAYPSPQLTAAELDIIYRCAQKAGFDPRSGSLYTDRINIKSFGDRGKELNIAHDCKYLYDEDSEDKIVNAMVAENRWKLIDQYYRRTQPTPKSRDLSQFLDYDKNKYEGVSVIIKDESLKNELEEAQKIHDLEMNGIIEGVKNLVMSYRRKDQEYELNTLSVDDNSVKFHYTINKTIEGYYCTKAYIEDKTEKLKEIFTGYNKEEENPIFFIGDEFFLKHILYFLFPHYLEDAIGDLCWCDLKDLFYKAMPQEIIDCISEEITTFSKLGYFENDLYEVETIDRMEKCTVLNPKGLKIDLIQQMQNIKKLYSNTKESFTIFYDAKTMIPFTNEKILDEKILTQKCVRIDKDILTQSDYLIAIKNYLKDQYDSLWVDSLTNKDYVINKVIKEDTYLVYFNIIKKDYINLKYGTVYYKFSRTIDEDNTEQTFIGTDLSIDVDTFGGEYLIVGETYIREQQTGKDQRCQIVLPRTTISASTSLKLQASGDPTTFSIDVNILMPINKKAMLELRQYNVEEDKIEGGYKIIPQNKHHSYTPTIEVFEQIVPKNNEIY